MMRSSVHPNWSRLLLVLLLCPSAVIGFVPGSTSYIPNDTHNNLHAAKSTTRRYVSGADIEKETITASGGESSSPVVAEAAAAPSRGKVNEIDFCIAPADVSLSRSYSSAAASTSTLPKRASGTTMLVSSDKSTTAPVLSLTRALNNASNRAVRRILLARAWPSAEALNKSFRQAALAEKQREAALQMGSSTTTPSGAKCPIPRPILNLLVRRRVDKKFVGSKDDNKSPTTNNNNNNSNQRSPRSRTDEEYVMDQLNSFRELYGNLPGYSFAEAYLESILSLATSGMESPRVTQVMDSGIYDESYRRIVGVLRTVGAVFEGEPFTGTSKIAPILLNQDICLSMLDKLQLKKGSGNNQQQSINKKGDKKIDDNDDEMSAEELGGLLSSAKEPTMTRELNSLSNIVQRALLFGGDQEILVLFETLVADRPRFAERWYPNTGSVNDELELEEETRPGMQYFNCLLKLLSECYNYGVVSSLDPPLPLLASYANAYERLMATLVELGSGYIRPTTAVSGVTSVMNMPKPRTSREELGRFAVWESTFRQKNGADVAAYPDDLVGKWQVKDLIGSELIGVSTVEFLPQGQVSVAPPLEGLRWRLDPGPTHLDTCTFQVLSDDKTILQYRGFIDRGARLESRFSKRPINIRGSVMFQMRDGETAILGEDYWKDMLPFNYRTGTTKFVMKKIVE